MINGRFTGFFRFGLFCLIVMAGFPGSVISQCIPDTINCIDVDSPGQICPRVLPEGRVGVTYEESITVLAPDSAYINRAWYALAKITVDKIENLPAGINYSAETFEYFPNKAYCISVHGTPRDTGTYYLGISVTPYIPWLNIELPLPVQIDSTSVFMKIKPSTSADPLIDKGFALLEPFPNPVEESSRIGFSDNAPMEAELLIYNMLGRQVYSEVLMSSGGRNYFQYKCTNLNPGCYFYIVRRGMESVSGRFIKSR